MALIHKFQGNFNIDIDFEKQDKQKQAAMTLDHLIKTSRRLSKMITFDVKNLVKPSNELKHIKDRKIALYE
jgi:hypothetical protein